MSKMLTLLGCVLIETRLVHHRQNQSRLILILPGLVGITHRADPVGLDEDHLGDAFVGVDLRGEGGGVGNFDRDLAPIGWMENRWASPARSSPSL